MDLYVVLVREIKNFPIFWDRDRVSGSTLSLIKSKLKNLENSFQSVIFYTCSRWSTCISYLRPPQTLFLFIWTTENYFWNFQYYTYHLKSCFKNTLNISKDGEIFVFIHLNNIRFNFLKKRTPVNPKSTNFGGNSGGSGKRVVFHCNSHLFFQRWICMLF